MTDPSDERWWHQAACKGKPDHLFDSGGPGRLSRNHEGLAICRACPVREQCLQDALATGDTYGIRGGLTGPQRIDLLARRRRARYLGRTA